MIRKALLVSFIFLSFAGFLDALYLTFEHYFAAPLPCVIFKGCKEVLTSKHATIFSLPTPLYGAIYYLILLVAGIFYIDTNNTRVFAAVSLFTAVGFLASFWFVYLQFFILNAICTYCMLSAAISSALFVLGILIFRKLKPYL